MVKASYWHSIRWSSILGKVSSSTQCATTCRPTWSRCDGCSTSRCRSASGPRIGELGTLLTEAKEDGARWQHFPPSRRKARQDVLEHVVTTYFAGSTEQAGRPCYGSPTRISARPTSSGSATPSAVPGGARSKGLLGNKLSIILVLLNAPRPLLIALFATLAMQRASARTRHVVWRGGNTRFP